MGMYQILLFWMNIWCKIGTWLGMAQHSTDALDRLRPGGRWSSQAKRASNVHTRRRCDSRLSYGVVGSRPFKVSVNR
jgi:hypothetical protein